MHGCSLETKRGLLNESQRCIVRQWQRSLAGPVFVLLRRAVRSAEIRSSGKRSYPAPRSAGARIASSGKICGVGGDPRAGRVAGLRSGGRLVRPSVGAKADLNSELVFKKYRFEIPTLAKSARVEHPRCGCIQKNQSSRPDHREESIARLRDPRHDGQCATPPQFSRSPRTYLSWNNSHRPRH
jgi:hypothetical protein